MSVILWILSLVLGVILTILIKEPIHKWLIKLLGGMAPRRRRGVKGLWRATHSGESDGLATKEINLIELRQFGKHVIGKNLSGSDRYRLEGKLNTQIHLTGIWESVVDDSIYNGAFQLMISPKGDTMEGRWIGFSKKGYIKHGIWVWERLSRSIDSESKAKLLQDFPNSNP
jgi:hypothetical protein